MTAAPRKKRTTPSRPKGTASPISRPFANGGHALRHSAANGLGAGKNLVRGELVGNQLLSVGNVALTPLDQSCLERAERMLSDVALMKAAAGGDAAVGTIRRWQTEPQLHTGLPQEQKRAVSSC
jgi:hypothetical protein